MRREFCGVALDFREASRSFAKTELMKSIIIYKKPLQKFARAFDFLANAVRLLTQAEGFDNCAVALDVSVVEIVEESTTLAYQLGQCTSSTIIFTVLFKMFRQMGNTV